MKNIFYLLVLVIFVTDISFSQTTLDTINVITGWNNIGALSSGATIDIIDTEPPGIINSTFYGFNPGGSYYQADSLTRGSGYWVKVSQNGKIIIGLSIPFVCGTSKVFFGNEYYGTVQIGGQCWFRENLNIGTQIIGSQNQTNNGILEKYCWGDDIANCNSYGGLYLWDEAMQYTNMPSARGICPEGWHLPTLDEFNMLKVNAGNTASAIKTVGLKWSTIQATNTTGFSAMFTGDRQYSSNYYFYYYNEAGYYWSSTESSSTEASRMFVWYNSDDIMTNSPDVKDHGYSIRCLKD